MCEDGFVAAVLADIHGNRWALEAVLDDARAAGAGLVIDLGDVVYGPLDPGGTVETLRQAGLPVVRVLGNEDRVVWEIEGPDPDHPSLEHTRSSLDHEQTDWLRQAPPETTWDRMLLVHGRPGRDDRYLLEVVEPVRLRPASAAAVSAALAGIDADVVLCGHSHVPRIVAIEGGCVVVNPGSVGLQAYTDSRPWPHAVENGDPLARYARLVASGGRWLATLHTVPYDWTAAAREARRHGRSDWARALETGRA